MGLLADLFSTMISVALCLLLAVGALAQIPTTCPGPKQFEGRFQRFDRERQEYIRGFITYDETMHRQREFEEVDITGKKTAYDKLRLYDQNPPVQYVVDMSTKKCNISAPDHRWHPAGVPEGAQFIGEGVVGASGIAGEHVADASFGHRFDDGAEFFIDVTEPDCFPVASGYKKGNESEFRNYYDVKSGIADPDVFYPPKECTHLL